MLVSHNQSEFLKWTKEKIAKIRHSKYRPFWIQFFFLFKATYYILQLFSIFSSSFTFQLGHYNGFHFSYRNIQNFLKWKKNRWNIEWKPFSSHIPLKHISTLVRNTTTTKINVRSPLNISLVLACYNCVQCQFYASQLKKTKGVYYWLEQRRRL